MTTMGPNPVDRGPDGYSYAAVLVGPDDGTQAGSPPLATLRALRFTGWVAPREDGWQAAVCGAGSVGSGRRGVVGVGEALAAATPGPVVAVRVLEDRQLVVVAWSAGVEVARYVSDPSSEPGAGEDVLDDPFGAGGAAGLAAACGVPEGGERLRELLARRLSEDEIESERLAGVLSLLSMPTWLVSSWRLPRRMSVGPDPRDLTRLGAGRTGPAGRLLGPVVGRVRRWRPPPPVLADPPQGYGDLDDPMLWM